MLVVANDAAGLKQLKKAVAIKYTTSPSSSWRRRVNSIAWRIAISHDSGFKVAIVNPLRSRKFAEAIGTLAKTDRVDARMLAMMGESLTPDAIAPPPELIEDLQELARGRESFVDDRTAVLNQIGASKSCRADRRAEASAARSRHGHRQPRSRNRTSDRRRP